MCREFSLVKSKADKGEVGGGGGGGGGGEGGREGGELDTEVICRKFEGKCTDRSAYIAYIHNMLLNAWTQHHRYSWFKVNTNGNNIR